MVLGSLSDLGKVFGIKPKERRKDKPFRCRICGAEMRKIPGTNVVLCDGKDGVECGNRLLLRKSI